MLSIHALRFQYLGMPQAALDGITLHVQRGQILGLLGPNGAGKTTLISHLAGHLSIQQGTILIDDMSLATVRQQHPTRIALAPQDYAFYPMLSVRENLACFAAVARLSGSRARQRSSACMAFTQLERFADTRADQLSGGLRRRLNLAIALLPSPELILLDEPTVGVDPQSRAFILDAVRQLAHDGAAIIYTSHYMDEIEAIAGRIAIIDGGHLLREASLPELLAEGARQLVIASDNIAPEALLALLSSWGDASLSGGMVSLTPKPGTTPATVLAAIESAGGHLTQVHYGHRNLEQLFMRLTRRSLRD